MLVCGEIRQASHGLNCRKILRHHAISTMRGGPSLTLLELRQSPLRDRRRGYLGDQAGVLSLAELWVKRNRPAPSTLITYSSKSVKLREL
jgi:hypothetical protein